MTSDWTTWKQFPVVERGENIEAPIGPGVYEVRQVSNGDLVAFGHTGNVAQALLELAPARRRPFWRALFGAAAARPGVPDLEYRTCATATEARARMVVEHLIGRRQVYWRRTRFSGSLA